MYSTCLHCNAALGANDVLETLPVGRRLAFDASKGRLWVVCQVCGKWNLVPFDTRLETIDACERFYRDTVTRYSTDTIGLARLRDGLELVRIGAALRPEFAAWRYGESYRRRRRKTLIAGGVGAAVVGGAVIAVGAAGVSMGAMGYMVMQLVKGGWKSGVRRQARLRLWDPEREGKIHLLEYKHVRAATLVLRGDEIELDIPRPYLVGEADRPLTWRGGEVRTIGRRVTGGLNALAGKREQIADATELLARYHGDLGLWLRVRAQAEDTSPAAIDRKKRPPYWEHYDAPALLPKLMQDEERLALEMWLNEDIERKWLEGELRMLEREWREAERIAKIADDLVLEDVSPGK